MQRYKDAKKVAFKALKRLDEICKSPSKIKDIPDAMLTDKSSLEEFADFFKAPMYSYLVNIYVNQNVRDSARYWLFEFESNPSSHDPRMSLPIIDPILKLGMTEKAVKYIANAEEFYSKDTLAADYTELLLCKALYAKMQGKTDEVYSLCQRAKELDAKRVSADFNNRMSDYATKYMLQEEQISRQDAELRFNVLLSIVVLSIVIIIAVFGVIFWMKRQKKHEKKVLKELEKAKEEITKLEARVDTEAQPARKLTSEELYERVLFVMDNQKPYVDPDFDIKSLAMLVFSSRTPVSAAINQISGKNFRTWLADYRVDQAKKLMKAEPEVDTDKILVECGFDNTSTLYRHFKSVTGMTPGEYKQSIQAAKGVGESNSSFAG